MNPKYLYPALTLVLGSTAGFIAGKSGASAPAEAQEEQTALARSSRSTAEVSAASKRGPGSGRPRSMEEINAIPGQLQRMQALLEFYAGLTPEEMEAEAKKLESMNMPERMMASYVLFAKWAETDPVSAMAYSDRMGFTGMFVRPTIMQSWASVDPVAASKYYSENPGQFAMMGMFGGRGGGPMGGGAASIIAGEWARQNPDDAMAWAKTLGGGEKGNAVNSIISQVALNDPQKAMALAAQLEGGEKSRANRQIAEVLGAKSWEEAQQFVASLPADQQDDARRRAFEGLANANPSEAARQLSTIADEQQRLRATATVAERMSRENPQQAFELVVSSGSEMADDAMRNVMMNYSRQDSVGAMNAIQQLPQGSARDTAIGTFVFANSSNDHAQTMALAESISDERDRARAIGISAAKWMATDAEAAKAAVQQSTALSDEMKTRIIEGGQNWRGWGRGGRGGR
ncbi:MAG: hypothetical protein EAZ81_08565 [Verrucomicrobia bacterium]|nr:MAG: hypothetical protein EAZ81_08565 [Verrucomicrobiota bacterium]